MRAYLVAALAFWAALPVSAQINTERLRKDIEPGQYYQFDFGGGFAAGNTDYVQFGVGGRMDIVGEGASAFAVAHYVFNEVDNVTDVSSGFVHARYNHPLVPRVVGEAFAQVERNEQTLLERRYLVGAGARFEVLETEPLGIALGTTPMFEYERLQASTMEDPAGAFRWSNYLSVRVDVSDTAEALGVVYVQPRVSEPDDVRVLHESRLDVSVSSRFKIRVRAGTRFDSEPPVDVDRTDVMLTTGFVFSSIGD